MSAPRWRWSLIGVWLALTGMTFIAIDGMAARSWLLLLVFGVVPPAMLLWLWNEDRPLLIGSLRKPRNAVNATGERAAGSGMARSESDIHDEAGLS